MLRTPLLRPGEYFRRRSPDRNLGQAFVVVWKAYIWRDGLVEVRGTSPDLATGLAVLAGLIAFIGAVVH